MLADHARMLLVVQHQEQRRTAAHGAQQVQQQVGVVVGEVAGGLVHHQQRRFANRFAQDGHGAQLHRRQLHGQAVKRRLQLRKTHARDVVGKPAAQLQRRQRKLLAHLVCQRVQCGGGHQAGVLLHQARPVSLRHRLALVQGRAPFLVACIGGVEPGQRAQHGGFARARRAQQHGDGSGRHLEIHFRQHHLGAKNCAQALDCQAMRVFHRQIAFRKAWCVSVRESAERLWPMPLY